MGRASVDIIKSGGYKISAPQIEDAILAHPDVDECAVMGAPDEAQGELVAAVIAFKQAKEASFADLLVSQTSHVADFHARVDAGARAPFAQPASHRTEVLQLECKPSCASVHR